MRSSTFLRALCSRAASSAQRTALLPLRCPRRTEASALHRPPSCAYTALYASSASLHTSRLYYAPADVPVDLAKDIKDIIEHDRIVVFLTGTPEQPRCRFTVQLVDLLNQLGIKYGFFNILDDDEICEGLKKYSDWPTYPQVYLDGELLGGYDICKSMMLDGSLIRTLKEKELM